MDCLTEPTIQIKPCKIDSFKQSNVFLQNNKETLLITFKSNHTIKDFKSQNKDMHNQSKIYMSLKKLSSARGLELTTAEK